MLIFSNTRNKNNNGYGKNATSLIRQKKITTYDWKVFLLKINI